MSSSLKESSRAIPGVAICLNCGVKPGRPKFCGRSCAAIYNNKVSPKRRPEGQCTRCGKVCSASKRLCEQCREIFSAEAKEKRRRAEANIQQWITLEGALADEPVPRVHVGRKTVFENGRFGEHWTLKDPCGVFLDHLMGIIFARPEYIHSADIPRYATWVDAFRRYTTDRPMWDARPKRLPVPKLPLDEIGYALRRWIESFLGHDNPLMASFALDAADFIVLHAFGSGSYQYRTENNWELPRLVMGERQHGRDADEQIHDKRLKKDITEYLRRGSATVARGVVPPDGAIIGGSETASVKRGTAFFFQIDRCHLSDSWYDYPQHWEDIYLAEQELQHDIAETFSFPGILLLQRDHPEINWQLEGHLGEWLAKDLHTVADRGIKTYIPARWLTHWIESGRFDEPRKEHPITPWAPQLMDPGIAAEQDCGATLTGVT
jgi:hypothetical protein